MGQLLMLGCYFERVSHNKETRNNNIVLRGSKIKLESTKMTLFYNDVVAYNILPLGLRADYNSFCKKLELLLGIQTNLFKGTDILLLASFLSALDVIYLLHLGFVCSELLLYAVLV